MFGSDAGVAGKDEEDVNNEGVVIDGGKEAVNEEIEEYVEGGDDAVFVEEKVCS